MTRSSRRKELCRQNVLRDTTSTMQQRLAAAPSWLKNSSVGAGDCERGENKINGIDRCNKVQMGCDKVLSCLSLLRRQVGIFSLHVLTSSSIVA